MPPPRNTERKTTRLEAFSDAVLAIAITLPAFGLEAPEFRPGTDRAAEYARLGPQYAAYALSFLVIGLYWAASHFSGKIVRATDHGFNLLTLLFLACVSITSFPAAPFVQYAGDPANAGTAATVYAAVLAAPALVWPLRWRYSVWRGFPDPRLEPAYLIQVRRRYDIGAALYLVGVALTAWVDWRLGMALVALVTLSYAWPPMTPRYRPGQEPRDELEEADEQPAPA